MTTSKFTISPPPSSTETTITTSPSVDVEFQFTEADVLEGSVTYTANPQEAGVYTTYGPMSLYNLYNEDSLAGVGMGMMMRGAGQYGVFTPGQVVGATPTPPSTASAAGANGAALRDMAGRLATLEKGQREIRAMLQTLLDGRDAPEATVADAPAEDPLERARQRGAQAVGQILQRAEMLSSDAFATLTGMSRQALHERRKRKEALALQGATRDYRFPSWQVTADGKLLPQLPELFDALGGSAWTVYRFLRQPHGALDDATALEALQDGRVDDVLSLARSVERGDFT